MERWEGVTVFPGLGVVIRVLVHLLLGRLGDDRTPELLSVQTCFSCRFLSLCVFSMLFKTFILSMLLLVSLSLFLLLLTFMPLPGYIF